jgi:hypothetical protein
MAGLLYLPRLFVYHAMAPVGSDCSETFKVMERRLQRGIMVPAMIATWGFGLLLAGTPGVVDWQMGWIWAKLGLVLGLARWLAGRVFVGSQPPYGAVFSRDQRAANCGADRDRRVGGGQAVLTASYAVFDGQRSCNLI